ncbi:MAG: ABC transporter ATP-binding protein [Hyphomicrobiales bacterium]|nr:ABC transporter ATP-binding protein [Hyphomicrobiales bacterium]
MPKAVTSTNSGAAELPTKALSVRNICKDYHTNIGLRRVLDDVSFSVAPGEKIGVLGRNGAGKSTLVKIIGGAELPTSGTIERGLFMSWPLALSGGFDGNMSGLANTKFIARIYDKPVDDMIAFVDDFAELGAQLKMPVKMYSSGMRMRLAFALTLAVDFECFLIDEVTAVGDARFNKKCHEALFERRAHCAMVIISHDIGTIKSYCNKALVMKNGRAKVIEDIDFAISIYQGL